MTASTTFQSERLRLARHFWGLSQADLGERVGVSRQFIHQLETGKPPSNDMLLALADALDVYPGFFFESTEEVAPEHCHFRKLHKTPMAVAQQAIAHGSLFSGLVSYIEHWLSLPEVDFPQVEVSEAEDIEVAAEGCRQHWGLTIDQPIKNITRVVERAGAITLGFNGISTDLDALSIDHHRPLIVRSSIKESPTRYRFDIAHECGHLVMHRGIHTGDKSTEAQADRFASAFLLPRRAFVNDYRCSTRLDWKHLFAMKVRWNVSVQAIIRRAFDLGLMDAALYRRANIYVRKNGWKKSEPHEPSSTELPELISIALNSLRDQYGKTLQEISAHLRLKPNFFGRLIGVELGDVSLAATVASDRVIDLNRYRRR